MRTPIRLSRATLGAAALFVGSLLPAAPAHAAPSSCTTVRGTPSCEFSCRAGDLITVDAVGSDDTGGSNILSGNAICGGAVAHCDGGPRCHGEDTASSNDDTGICDLSGDGAVEATCTAGDPAANVEPCNLVESLCNILPAVDSIVCPIVALLSPGVPGVVDITPEGDVRIAGELLWDCPPYGN